MFRISNIFPLKCPAILGTALLLSTSAIAAEDIGYQPTNSQANQANLSGTAAQATGPMPQFPVEVAQVSLESLESGPMGQLTNVSQLRDVAPTDWAYEALRSLVERYGCIVGYPDQTFRGNRALTRWEFAAGLNACMEQMERLIAATEAVVREDIEKLQRLAQEFEAELAALGARIDNLEGRVAFLEDHQFSTTTKLVGEVALTLAQAFGDQVDNGTGRRDLDAQATFTDRVRLQFVTSFTGKDTLFTRLTAGNLENSFQDEIGDFEGRFAYDGQFNNDVTIDRLHYYFPIGNNLKIFTMASLGGHHFYADTFNSGLEAGGGANGALSRFAERNPIYRLGLGGQGVGATYKFNNLFELSAGYLARGGNDPSPGSGLFNGNYSAMGQFVYKPTDTIKFGFTYMNGYDTTDRLFAFGGTGTLPGNLRLTNFGVPNQRVSSNTYGIEGQFDINPSFSIRAWGGFTDAKLIGLGKAEIWNYALVFAFPDLGKEGSLGYIVFGAEPYLGGLEIPDRPRLENDSPFHIEVAHKYQITENISLTPGVILLTAPNQDSDNNDTVVIGALRTTFTF